MGRSWRNGDSGLEWAQSNRTILLLKMFPLCQQHQLQRAQLRHITPVFPSLCVMVLPLCCQQASSQCFLSEVKFNVKTQVKARIPQNVSLLHNCPVNHFRTNCDKVTFSCRKNKNKTLRVQKRLIYVLVLCPKVSVCPPCALVSCGLTSKLRKKPLSPFHYSCW